MEVQGANWCVQITTQLCNSRSKVFNSTTQLSATAMTSILVQMRKMRPGKLSQLCVWVGARLRFCLIPKSVFFAMILSASQWDTGAKGVGGQPLARCLFPCFTTSSDSYLLLTLHLRRGHPSTLSAFPFLCSSPCLSTAFKPWLKNASCRKHFWMGSAIDIINFILYSPHLDPEDSLYDNAQIYVSSSN